MGRLLSSLPPAERAECYRQFARSAVRKAQAVTDEEYRAEYLTMASGWHSLALEIERSLEFDPDTDQSELVEHPTVRHR